jgi:hexosaminidase
VVPAPVPCPARSVAARGSLHLGAGCTVGVEGERSARLVALAGRLADRLARQTGDPPPEVRDHSDVRIAVGSAGLTDPYPRLSMDESYRLLVTERGARIEASTAAGASHGVETLLQLVDPVPEGFRIPAGEIIDAPRFAWRGLLLDVCRHWMPLDAVLRTIDVMAAVKLNVLHLHLTEDQAFRFESRAFPGLHERGSDGRFFTQDELRVIVEHAAERAVRVVPELDVPGHVTSWLVAYPELAATEGPFELRREFGIANVALDPENEHVYDVLDALVGELAAVFPDDFVHTGGDEVDAAAWPHVEDARAAQAEFTRRAAAIVAGHGRRMVVWDEALTDDLPEDVVVQAWRGPRVLHDAVRAGHQTLLSAGWYLDHLLAARHLHAVDPLAEPDAVAAAQREIENDSALAGIRPILAGAHRWQGDPARLARLTPAEAARVLGGEACMWTELVTDTNLDQRIWPRTAAVADRLWAPPPERPDALDTLDRVTGLGAWLERSAGSTHRSARDEMLAALANGALDELRVLSDALEPVKWYTRLFADLPVALTSDPPDRRGEFHYTATTPLDRLVDATPPESATARRLTGLLKDLGRDAESVVEALVMMAGSWRLQRIALEASSDPRIAEVLPLSRDLADCAGLLDDGAAALRSGMPLAAPIRDRYERILDRASAPCAELWFAVGPPLRRLLQFSADVRAR